MSHSNVRKDKTCLNCRHVVENKFCPNCGQKNEDTRKTFHHLFVHFFEDLTHYENAFWKTIRNLIFKPSALTKEYLSGKRLSYLAPVRLYIFISFVTFFILTVFTETNMSKNLNIDEKDKNRKLDSIERVLEKTQNLEKPELDSLKVAFKKAKEEEFFVMNFGYKTIKEMDSIRKYSKTEEISDIDYYLNKKSIEINNKYTKKEIIEKFIESFSHNLPKVLFIYMPLFAFFLWLFHNKKKYYYFDHGIFTLHYFSFLLLIILILFILTKLIGLVGDSDYVDNFIGIIDFVGFGWMFYYFFPAHHRFYGGSRLKSFIKSIILFFINMILVLILLTIFMVYTFINIH